MNSLLHAEAVSPPLGLGDVTLLSLQLLPFGWGKKDSMINRTLKTSQSHMPETA